MRGPGEAHPATLPPANVAYARTGTYLKSFEAGYTGDHHQGYWGRVARATDRRMIRRMPRLQVYLPDTLYRAVKERHLPASELLQGAVRAELRRQELLEETDRYLSELIEEVGEPSPASVAKAERLAGRVRGEKARASKAN